MTALYRIFTDRIERHLRVDADYFVSGGFWLGVAQVATVLTSLVASVFFARYLTENEFGIYRYIIGLAVLFSTLSLTGIRQAILQAATKQIGGFYHLATRQTLMYSIPMVGASFVGALYYYIQDNQTLAIGCLLIGLLFPWSFLLQNIQAHHMGQQRFRQSTILQTSKAVFVAGSTVATLFVTTNILWLLVSYFASQAIAGLVAHLWYRPGNSSITDRPAADKLLSFARHTTLRNFITGVSSRLDTILVFQFLGAGSLAIFAIATLIPDQVKGGLKSLVVLLIPKFAQNDSLAKSRKYLPTRSLQLGILLVGITIIFIICVPFVINTFFPKYTEAIIYAQILALGFPASIYQIPLAMMQAHTSEKALYWYHISTAIAQIIFTLLGIYFFGLLGAISARVMTHYAQLAATLFAIYLRCK